MPVRSALGWVEQFQRRGGAGQMAARQMHIAHGGRNVTVTEEPLHGGQVHAGFDQVSGESVAQRVNATFTRDAGSVAGGAVDPLRRTLIDWRGARDIGKQPPSRSTIAPVVAQPVEQSRRKQRVAILAPFALAHLEAHAIGGALDVGQLQGTHFGDRKSTRLNSSHGYISY